MFSLPSFGWLSLAIKDLNEFYLVHLKTLIHHYIHCNFLSTITFQIITKIYQHEFSKDNIKL